MHLTHSWGLSESGDVVKALRQCLQGCQSFASVDTDLRRRLGALHLMHLVSTRYSLLLSSLLPAVRCTVLREAPHPVRGHTALQPSGASTLPPISTCQDHSCDGNACFVLPSSSSCLQLSLVTRDEPLLMPRTSIPKGTKWVPRDTCQDPGTPQLLRCREQFSTERCIIQRSVARS